VHSFCPAASLSRTLVLLYRSIEHYLSCPIPTNNAPSRPLLRRPRPRCSDGQLRVRLLQQRRRCDVSLHEVRGRNVPGHGGAGLLQAMPCWLSLFEDCVADPRRLARTPCPLVQVLIDALQPSFVVRVGVTSAHLADVCTEPGLRSSRQRCC
jgi:hypothetical protein